MLSGCAVASQVQHKAAMEPIDGADAYILGLALSGRPPQGVDPFQLQPGWPANPLACGCLPGQRVVVPSPGEDDRGAKHVVVEACATSATVRGLYGCISGSWVELTRADSSYFLRQN